MTASERLSLEEEYEAQRSWIDDPQSRYPNCPFALNAELPPRADSVLAGLTAMIALSHSTLQSALSSFSTAAWRRHPAHRLMTECAAM